MEQIEKIIPATDWWVTFVYRDKVTDEMELEAPQRRLCGA